MTTEDLVNAGRGVVDAFNAADWERCKAILESSPFLVETLHGP